MKQYAGLMESHDVPDSSRHPYPDIAYFQLSAAKEGLYENIADHVGLKVAYEVRMNLEVY